MTSLTEGVVKWYDRRRGEGFIQRREGPDVHVPASALLRVPGGFLVEGQAVEFELLPIPGGFRAREVRLTEAPQPGAEGSSGRGETPRT